MIRTWLNTPFSLKEKVYPPSLTIPDQSLTIREILQRFSKGQDLDVMHPVYYDGEEGDVGFEHIDPTLSGDYDLSDATRDLQEIEDNKMKFDELKRKAIEQKLRSEAEHKSKAKAKAVKRGSEADEPEGDAEGEDLTS